MLVGHLVFDGYKGSIIYCRCLGRIMPYLQCVRYYRSLGADILLFCIASMLDSWQYSCLSCLMSIGFVLPLRFSSLLVIMVLGKGGEGVVGLWLLFGWHKTLQFSAIGLCMRIFIWIGIFGYFFCFLEVLCSRFSKSGCFCW